MHECAGWSRPGRDRGGAIADRVEALDWERCLTRPRRAGQRGARAPALPGRMPRGGRRSIRTTTAFAAASSWRGTATAAANTSISRIRCPRVVAELRSAFYPRLAPHRQSLERGMGIDVRYPATHADFLARCHAAGQVQADTAAASVRSGGLQLPAPGSLRRACVSVAGGDPAVGARARLHRRRVRADGAATAHAVAPRGRPAAARRRRDLRRSPSPGAGHARHATGSTSAMA